MSLSEYKHIQNLDDSLRQYSDLRPSGPLVKGDIVILGLKISASRYLGLQYAPSTDVHNESLQKILKMCIRDLDGNMVEQLGYTGYKSFTGHASVEDDVSVVVNEFNRLVGITKWKDPAKFVSKSLLKIPEHTTGLTRLFGWDEEQARRVVKMMEY